MVRITPINILRLAVAVATVANIIIFLTVDRDAWIRMPYWVALLMQTGMVLGGVDGGRDLPGHCPHRRRPHPPRRTRAGPAAKAPLTHGEVKYCGPSAPAGPRAPPSQGLAHGGLQGPGGAR
jgi:hypothetical protein